MIAAGRRIVNAFFRFQQRFSISEIAKLYLVVLLIVSHYICHRHRMAKDNLNKGSTTSVRDHPAVGLSLFPLRYLTEPSIRSTPPAKAFIPQLTSSDELSVPLDFCLSRRILSAGFHTHPLCRTCGKPVQRIPSPQSTPPGSRMDRKDNLRKWISLSLHNIRQCGTCTSFPAYTRCRRSPRWNKCGPATRSSSKALPCG